MPRRTFRRYVFVALVRACIFLLQNPIVPYALALAACCLGANWSQSPARWAIVTRVTIGSVCTEIVYVLFVWLPFTKRLEEPAKYSPPSSSAERRILFERCMGTVPNYEHYLRMWFLGAEMSAIRRDNVREFLLWAFFDIDEKTEGSNLVLSDREDYDEEVNRYIACIEIGLGKPFEPGGGPAKCLRLTVDSVDQKYRTVWWYAFVALLDHVTHVIFLLRGFEYYAQSQAKPVFPPRIQQVFAKRRSTAGSLSYWHRPHRSTGLPVVFFHGIGVGLGPYIRFLTEVAGGNSNGQTGVIALEILPVCFRLTGPPLGKEAFLRQFKAILDRHAWSEFTLVSHSYGSILSTHAMRCPEIQARIPRAVLVDPVSIMLHLPDVAYNFTRRRPKTVNEWVMWYFAATDPGVAHCLGRYFFWRENAIWADELTGYGEVSDSASDERIKERRITVCLAELDLIVNTRAVARYLAGGDWTECPARLRGEQGRHNHVEPPNGPVQGVQSFNHRSSHSGINIIWLPEKDHAEVFFSGRDRERVVAVIRDYCRA